MELLCFSLLHAYIHIHTRHAYTCMHAYISCIHTTRYLGKKKRIPCFIHTIHDRGMGHCYSCTSSSYAYADRREKLEKVERLSTHISSTLSPLWTCPVCLEEGVNSVCIPFTCTHLVCTQCIRSMAKVSYRDTPRCPLCRASIVHDWRVKDKLSVRRFNNTLVLGMLEHVNLR